MQIHPKVQSWLDDNDYDLNEQIDIFGRPDYRASFSGKYSLKRES